MPTRKFHELVESIPTERQQRIANRVQESLASMPLEEIRKARQMTQAKLAETLGFSDAVRAIPIVAPAATHAVGLVVPHREPMTPLIAALTSEARQLAAALDGPSRPPTDKASPRMRRPAKVQISQSCDPET